MHLVLLLALVVSAAAQFSQILDKEQVAALGLGGEGGEEADEDHPEFLVIPNKFPDRLNFLCFSRTRLQRERFCYGSVDSWAIACSEGEPPIQLIPFCLAFEQQCSHISFPNDEWCEDEFDKYERHCTRVRRQRCHNKHYDVSCICEPYEPLLRRSGTKTAEWCQRYHLFCDEEKRRDQGNEVAGLMQNAVRVHKRCMNMFNLPHVICNPFRRNFDHQRCMKFLLDCELISDFSEEEKEEAESERAESAIGEAAAPMKKKKGGHAPVLTNEELELEKEIAALEAKEKTGGGGGGGAVPRVVDGKTDATLPSPPALIPIPTVDGKTDASLPPPVALPLPSTPPPTPPTTAPPSPSTAPAPAPSTAHPSNTAPAPKGNATAPGVGKDKKIDFASLSPAEIQKLITSMGLTQKIGWKFPFDLP